MAVRTVNVDVLSSFEQAVVTVAGPTTLEVSGGESGLDEQLMTRLRAVPGVTSVSPVILQTAVHMKAGQPGQAIQVLGLDLLAEFNTRGFRVSQQATERQMLDMIHPRSVFVGAKLAIDWNLSVGDEVHLLIGTGSCRCRVAGILHSESGRHSSWERLAVMDIAAAQVTFGMIGLVDRNADQRDAHLLPGELGARETVDREERAARGAGREQCPEPRRHAQRRDRTAPFRQSHE